MQKNPHFLILLIIIGLVIAGCNGAETTGVPTPFVETEGGDDFIGIPNPASFYCQEMGYELDLRDKMAAQKESASCLTVRSVRNGSFWLAAALSNGLSARDKDTTSEKAKMERSALSMMAAPARNMSSSSGNANRQNKSTTIRTSGLNKSPATD